MTLRRFLGALLAAAATLILTGCGNSVDPRPDLVFVSTRDGDYAIYEMNADGAGQRRVTDHDPDASSRARLFFQIEPAWSPDGRQIAFASRRHGSFDVYVMRADGTGTRRLTSSRSTDSHPTWSPDGSKIAFSRDAADIYVMNADGSGVRKITAVSASESEPSWSPDGKWIAYVRRAPGTEALEVWMMRPDGSGKRRLVSLGERSINPAWSPDSARVAFASNSGRGRFYDIYVVTVRDERARRLTSTGPDAFEPAWSPDGSTIAFTRDGSIVTIDLDGNEETLTKPSGNDSSPAWNPIPPPDGE
jgi:Tol biopolymer transport system component